MNLMNYLFNLLGPVILLLYLNGKIFRALKRNESLGEDLRRNRGGGVRYVNEQKKKSQLNALFREETLRKKDVRLTRIAIIIVSIFVICNMPR